MTVLSNVLNFFVSIFLVSTHLPQLQIKTKIKVSALLFALDALTMTLQCKCVFRINYF